LCRFSEAFDSQSRPPFKTRGANRGDLRHWRCFLLQGQGQKSSAIAAIAANDNDNDKDNNKDMGISEVDWRYKRRYL